MRHIASADDRVERQAIIARTGNRVKVDYPDAAGTRTTLWECLDNGVVETTFNHNGAILEQQLLCIGSNQLQAYVNKFAADRRLSLVESQSFENVKLRKRCPSCASYALERHTENKDSSHVISIMPIYQCGACSKKSYYLTDDYLYFLVANNAGLFSDAERSELKSNKHAFVSELRAYIIRVFAAKHIANIDD